MRNRPWFALVCYKEVSIQLLGQVASAKDKSAVQIILWLFARKPSL